MWDVKRQNSILHMTPTDQFDVHKTSNIDATFLFHSSIMLSFTELFLAEDQRAQDLFVVLKIRGRGPNLSEEILESNQ